MDELASITTSSIALIYQARLIACGAIQQLLIEHFLDRFAQSENPKLIMPLAIWRIMCELLRQSYNGGYQ